MITPKGVRITLAVIILFGIFGVLWAISLRDRYMMTRFISLIVIVTFVFVYPDTLIDNIQTRAGKTLLIAVISFFVVVGILIGGAVFIIKPLQRSHAAWLPKILKSWCTDRDAGRKDSNGPDCK